MFIRLQMVVCIVFRATPMAVTIHQELITANTAYQTIVFTVITDQITQTQKMKARKQR